MTELETPTERPLTVEEEARSLARRAVEEWPKALRAYVGSRLKVEGWAGIPPTRALVEQWIRAGRPARWKKDDDR